MARSTVRVGPRARSTVGTGTQARSVRRRVRGGRPERPEAPSRRRHRPPTGEEAGHPGPRPKLRAAADGLPEDRVFGRWRSRIDQRARPTRELRAVQSVERGRRQAARRHRAFRRGHHLGPAERRRVEGAQPLFDRQAERPGERTLVGRPPSESIRSLRVPRHRSSRGADPADSSASPRSSRVSARSSSATPRRRARTRRESRRTSDREGSATKCSNASCTSSTVPRRPCTEDSQSTSRSGSASATAVDSFANNRSRTRPLRSGEGSTGTTGTIAAAERFLADQLEGPLHPPPRDRTTEDLVPS